MRFRCCRPLPSRDTDPIVVRRLSTTCPVMGLQVSRRPNAHALPEMQSLRCRSFRGWTETFDASTETTPLCHPPDACRRPSRGPSPRMPRGFAFDVCVSRLQTPQRGAVVGTTRDRGCCWKQRRPSKRLVTESKPFLASSIFPGLRLWRYVTQLPRDLSVSGPLNPVRRPKSAPTNLV